MNAASWPHDSQSWSEFIYSKWSLTFGCSLWSFLCTYMNAASNLGLAFSVLVLVIFQWHYFGIHLDGLIPGTFRCRFFSSRSDTGCSIYNYKGRRFLSSFWNTLLAGHVFFFQTCIHWSHRGGVSSCEVCAEYNLPTPHLPWQKRPDYTISFGPTSVLLCSELC